MRDKKNDLLDTVILTLMIIAFMASLTVLGYVFGRKTQCQELGNLYSFDFGVCLTKDEVRSKIK